MLLGSLEAGVGREGGGGFPSFGGDAGDLGLDLGVSGGGGGDELGMGPVGWRRQRDRNGFVRVVVNWRRWGKDFGGGLELVVFATVFLVSRSMPYLSLASLAEIPAVPGIAHNKIMIIDVQTVLTGSFNFTKPAEENNAENLLVIHDPALAAKYTANWQLHQKHSESYVGKPTR